MIFAFMITQAARTLECFITKWATMNVCSFTMMVSNVDIKIGLVLQHFETIRTWKTIIV